MVGLGWEGQLARDGEGGAAGDGARASREKGAMGGGDSNTMVQFVLKL